MHECCRNNHYLMYAQYVKFRSGKGNQIMKILKQWILLCLQQNKNNEFRQK